MSELWDAYDNNFNILNGITLVRGEPIPEVNIIWLVK